MGDDYVRVLLTQSWVEGEIAKGRLESEGIPVDLKGEGREGPYPVGKAEVFVPSRFSRTGSGTFGSSASASVVSPDVRVGTSQVPRSTISSAASGSRNVPCSIERTPARTARLIPSGPCACDITHRPRSAAVVTIDSISRSEKCGSLGSSDGDRNPPVDEILMTSAPARTTSLTLVATPSTPSQIGSGMPG